MPIHAVIFDRDLTLVYFDQSRIAELTDRLSSISPKLSAESAYYHWRNWAQPWPRHTDEEPAFWRTYWETVAAEHQLSIEQIDRLVSEIGALYHTCFRAYPDALETVTYLHRQRIRLGVLTNFELPSVAQTLEFAGFDPRMFHALLSSAAIGVAKPDPQALYIAAASLDCAPEQCLFVDDLPENVAAARSIGMQALLVDRSNPVAQSSDHITSLLMLMERISPFTAA